MHDKEFITSSAPHVPCHAASRCVQSTGRQGKAKARGEGSEDVGKLTRPPLPHRTFTSPPSARRLPPVTAWRCHHPKRQLYDMHAPTRARPRGETNACPSSIWRSFAYCVCYRNVATKFTSHAGAVYQPKGHPIPSCSQVQAPYAHEGSLRHLFARPAHVPCSSAAVPWPAEMRLPNARARRCICPRRKTIYRCPSAI